MDNGSIYVPRGKSALAILLREVSTKECPRRGCSRTEPKDVGRLDLVQTVVKPGCGL